jgi:hypothetical protein
MNYKDTLPNSFTQSEYDLLTKYISKERILLEYGSGISTLKLSDQVKYLHSIEHDINWFNIITTEISKNNIQNVSLHLVEPDRKDSEYSYHTYDAEILNGSLGFKLFNKYINYQKDFEFDDIFIDGRARLHCADISYHFLKSDSVLIFHDFERTYYHNILYKFDILEQADKLVVLKKK